MAVIKINKTKNFTVMSNYHFKEKNMSLKAKGLLSLMLSLPEDWDYSIAGLIKLSSDGDTSVRNALKELEEFHYLQRKRVYQNGKIADWEYIIFEVPQENLNVDFQQVENQDVENNDNKILNNKNTKKYNKSSINTTVKSLLTKKPTLYEKASILIRNFTDDNDLQEALFRFLDLQIEISKQNGKQYYINVWKSKLNKLKSDFKEDEWLEIVKHSTEKGWQNFYPKKENNYTRYNVRPQDIGVTCERATSEELAENHRRALEREKNGKRGIF